MRPDVSCTLCKETLFYLIVIYTVCFCTKQSNLSALTGTEDKMSAAKVNA